MKKHKLFFYLLLFLILLPATVSASVGLTAFFAQASQDTITIVWETESETQNSGYNVYRTEENVDDFGMIVNKVRVNARPIAPLGELGGRYTVIDEAAATNITYYYWLEDIDTQGSKTHNGPALGRIERGSVINPVGVTVTAESNDPTQTPTPTTQPTTVISISTTVTVRPTNTPVGAVQPTATPLPSATPIEESTRVFITPPSDSTPIPTETPANISVTTTPLPTATPVSVVVNSPTPQPIQVNTATATSTPEPAVVENASPTTIIEPTQAIIIQPTTTTINTANSRATAVVIQPTVVSVATIVPQPTVIADSSNDAPTALGETTTTNSEPTGNLTIIAPETDVGANTEIIEQSVTPTAVVVSEIVAELEQSDPSQIGGEVADVQQPSVVQPQSDDNSLLLWFGLVAGGLLMLIGAGFALLFLGNRKR